jgi:TetR/AcrR family transcriptional regulator, transcriptional repressor of bet genes
MIEKEAPRIENMNTGKTTTPTEPAKGLRAAAKLKKRKAIIDAAVIAIAKYGLAGATMARIAEISGTSVGLTNFHFKSKEKLIEAVMIDVESRERSIWQEKNKNPSLTSKDRLLNLVVARFDPTLCSHDNLMIWYTFFGTPGLVDTYIRLIEPRDDEWLRAATDAMDELKEEAGLDSMNTYQSALGLAALMDGLHLNMLLYPDEFPADDSRKQAVNYVALLFPSLIPFEPIEGGWDD